MDESLRVYRLDSDKFAVNGLNLEKEQIEEIYKEIQKKTPSPCTMSSGVTKYAPEYDEDADVIYQQAENALDRAKKNGKNNQEFFSEDIYE